MEFTPLINLIIAAAILLIAAGTFLGFQMRNLAAESEKLAYKLYFELTRKADLLPQIVEKLSKYFGRESFDELIAARAATMAQTTFNADKKAKEEQLWSTFQGLWQNAQNKEEVRKDLVLTALQKDLNEADARIVGVRNAYNLTAKKYNNLAGNFLLKPVVLIIKAGKIESF
jgi:hypothetical protein